MRRSLPYLLPLISLTLMAVTCVPDRRSTAAGVTPILLVQGEGHVSPLVGQTVTVEGTVTAVRNERRVNGFWLQDSWSGDRDSSRPASWIDPSDDRVLASSGVFVYTKEPAPVEVGASVRVTGEVVEYERPGSLPVTQIEAVEIGPAASAKLPPQPVRIGPSGRHIPEVVDDDGLEAYQPREDAIDFWESLEGMMVEIGRSEVVGPTTRFGDFVVVPTAEAGDAARTFRGGVLLQEDPERPNGTEENTERIIVDSRPLDERREVSVGDLITSPLRGVLHYDFGNYRIIATDTFVVAPVDPPTQVLPSHDDDTLTVASFNVLNLAATDDSERFESVARTIVDAMSSPDVVGLQEIQDNTGGEDDGVVAADRTLHRLIEEIGHQGGPRYEWRQIDPIDNADGGAPGSNIRVAYLINPARVEVVDRGKGGSTDEVAVVNSVDGVALSLSPGRIGTSAECFLGEGSSDDAEGTRKSLALEVRFKGETWFIINNHLTSKRGDDAIYGSTQPPHRHTEEKRRCQAQIVAAVASEILRHDPNANVIVLGDMNEHEFRAPMEPLTDAGLVSMIERVPLESRYTYNYLGNSQVLDHILVSPAISESSKLTILHVNADVPDAQAASDHEPLLLFVETD